MDKNELQNCALIESHTTQPFRGKTRTINIYKRETDDTFWWANFGPEEHVEIVEVEPVTIDETTTYRQKSSRSAS